MTWNCEVALRERGLRPLHLQRRVARRQLDHARRLGEDDLLPVDGQDRRRGVEIGAVEIQVDVDLVSGPLGPRAARVGDDPEDDERPLWRRGRLRPGDGLAASVARATGVSAVKTSASRAARRPTLTKPARLCMSCEPFLEMTAAGAPNKPPPPRRIRRRVPRDSPSGRHPIPSPSGRCRCTTASTSR